MRPLLSALLLSTLAVSAYERLQGPTELVVHDPSKSFAGFTLFGVGNRTFLLDRESRVVHLWPPGTNPHLLDNGFPRPAAALGAAFAPGTITVLLLGASLARGHSGVSRPQDRPNTGRILAPPPSG